HPKIARLICLGTHSFQDRDYDFILEEFVDGGTLADLIRDGGHIDDDQTIALGRTLIDALVHLAELELVHRDIKPENVMYRTGTGSPVLVDFGLVRDLSASSLTPTHLMRGPGTPYFAAPEQLNNEKHLIDWRTDQFSLGVLLFYARFGAHPYQYAVEPLFSPATAERVAQRGPRGDPFYTSLQGSRFVCLNAMTKPWPVWRFRRAAELADAWEAQGESS
ncbi:MAG: protein kinase, partial [Anaerolineae bacterium]